MTEEDLTLPGTPGPVLTGVWRALSPSERNALLPHLIGATSADWLADCLQKFGHSVSASTIRTYRRRLSE